MNKNNMLSKYFILVLALLFSQIIRAEDESDVPAKSLSSVFNNRFSYSKETLESYLPEEESSEIIKTKRFNSFYSTDERESVPVRISVTGLKRKYDTGRLDNETVSFGARIGKTVPERNKIRITHNLSLNYRNKYYETAGNNSYDYYSGKFNACYLRKKDLKLTGSMGYDSYEYSESSLKDKNRFSGKFGIDKYAMGGDVNFGSFYKSEILTQKVAGRKKTKDEYALGFGWKMRKKFVHAFKIEGRAGFRDAKDDEYLDKDIDYKFMQSTFRTDHRIGRNYGFYNRASHYKKEYKGMGRFDNEGYELVQAWRLKPVNTKQGRLDFDVRLDYKKFNYSEYDSLGFKKAGCSLRCTFRKRQKFSLYAGAGFDRRNQKDNLKDRDDFQFSGGMEKSLPGNLLMMDISGRYIKRDFKNASDRSLYTVAVGIYCKI